MSYLRALKSVLLIAAIIYLFINWRVALGLYLVSATLHAFSRGPRLLLNSIVGHLLISGVACLFFNWRIGIILIIVSFALSQIPYRGRFNKN